MKVRNYEKKDLIMLLVIIFFILEIIGISYLIKDKEYTYYKISGVISNKNVITMIVDNNEKKILYNNQTIYLDNKNIKYKIKENRGVILKKNNKKYYEILIKIKLPKNKKTTDVLEFSIKNKKRKLIEIIKNIWKGG